jgi:putative nucleotidyltransferase with HDIG domain
VIITWMRRLYRRHTARGPGRLSLPVGYKVILPFLCLSMIAGLVASGLVGWQLASAARAQLDAAAIREQDSVASSFATFEQRQLTDLRTLVATQGVRDAVVAQNADALRTLVAPPVIAQLPDPVRVSVVLPGGRELISVRADAAHIGDCICGTGRDLSTWPRVGDVLGGRTDQYGPNYLGVQQDSDGPIMYVVGPITNQGVVVGAMLVGEPLIPLLQGVKQGSNFQVALYLPSGRALASNSSIPASVPLSAAERQLVLSQSGFVHHAGSGASPASEVFYVPWRLRHETTGYAGVVVPASALGAASTSIPLLMAAVFSTVFIVTVGAGLYISSRITRPLRNLVRATEAVGAGDLQYQARVTSLDEIGALTKSFNEMTSQLLSDRTSMEQSAEATIQTLAGAIDARDPYTHGHSMRVTRYSVELARSAGFDDAQVELVRRGCLVHDIGKIGVADQILRKPGPLDAEEWTSMRRHPSIGHEMLRPLNWAPEVLQIVRSHHERWDGRGYPDRLASDKIPQLARLVAVCDTLDAMTSNRPYRPGFSFDDAAREIRANSGSQFDPAMVAAFILTESSIRAMVPEDQAVPEPALDELNRLAI